MRVVQVSRHGGPEVLTLTEREPPPVPAGHARIQVAAIGVNFIDVQHRTGAYLHPLPYVPGSEGSGTVVEVAPDCGGVEVGQRVAWQGVPGAYAEQALVPSTRLMPVPDSVSDQQGAAVPVHGLTAHYLATSSFPVQPGNTVVVHAGAGGVGLLLTQVAKLRGARVISTVSTPDKARLARAAGADLVAGYHDFPDVVHHDTAGKGVAAVFDGIGRDTFERSLRCLARRGTLVLFGLASGHVPPFDLELLNRAGSLTITRPTLRDFVATPEEQRNRMDQLWSWLRQGKLEVHIGHTYRLDDVAAAHRDLEGRRTTGKVLLLP